MNLKFKDPINIALMIVGGAIVVIILIALFSPNNDPEKKVDSGSSWNDPGFSKSGSGGWPYYGKTNGQLIKELNKEYENHAVTPSKEKALYNKIGGMHPGRRSGPQYYDYDFLEVPISMTIVNHNGQRYYLLFKKGGVK